jgi:hypothetical protein
VPQDFRQLVKIAAVHHVPGRERVPQIVKTEIANAGQFQNRFETSFHALAFTRRSPFRRKNTILSQPQPTTGPKWAFRKECRQRKGSDGPRRGGPGSAFAVSPFQRPSSLRPESTRS